MHELAGVGAVDEAVIEAEAEILHRTNRNGVVAIGVGDDGGLLAQAADGEDGRFRLIDNRHSELAAKGANDSLIHVDWMIGSAELDIDGITASGAAEPLMRAGEWATAV